VIQVAVQIPRSPAGRIRATRLHPDHMNPGFFQLRAVSTTIVLPSRQNFHSPITALKISRLGIPSTWSLTITMITISKVSSSQRLFEGDASTAHTAFVRIIARYFMQVSRTAAKQVPRNVMSISIARSDIVIILASALSLESSLCFPPYLRL
jgi:hypothetical protein